MKSRNLFLGIIILFIGVVSLLAALDVFDFRSEEHTSELQSLL